MGARKAVSKRRFLETVVPAARRMKEKYGFPISVMVAQAILESAWGLSMLAREPHYNFFGIKKHAKCPGVSMLTTEYIGGKPQRVRCDFCSYGSPDNAFEDYCRVLSKPIYKRARERLKQNDVVGFVRELGKVYATDPNYAEKVLGVMNKYDLWKLDKGGDLDDI